LSAEGVPGAIRISADLREVRRLAEWLRTKCSEGGLGEMAAFDLELATVEAANNVVEHGYAESPQGEIGLDFEIDRGTAVITLTDRGTPVPQGLFEQCRPAPVDATEGRGIGIVQSCVDVVNYSTGEGLNRLTLIKLL
jgi:serine/threonine-protein kinase RsbW